YVFSKVLTDTDSYWASDFPGAADHYNRGLEKSIGAYDVTHNFKLGLVYDLPFGKGKKYLSSGPAAFILGNWRLSSIHYYSSGRPVTITSTITQILGGGNGGNSPRNAPFITTYDGWR